MYVCIYIYIYVYIYIYKYVYTLPCLPRPWGKRWSCIVLSCVTWLYFFRRMVCRTGPCSCNMRTCLVVAILIRGTLHYIFLTSHHSTNILRLQVNTFLGSGLKELLIFSSITAESVGFSPLYHAGTAAVQLRIQVDDDAAERRRVECYVALKQAAFKRSLHEM